jgi:hypothetical protein
MDPKYLWLSNGERAELPQRSVVFLAIPPSLFAFSELAGTI